MTDVVPLRRADPAELDRLAGARRALAEAEALPDVARLVDYGEAAKVAAKRAGLAEESQRAWAQFSLDAQRKAGELLRDMPKQAGARTAPPAARPLREVLDTNTVDEAYKRSQNWQRVAAVPEATFTEYRDTAPEPTRAGLLNHATAAGIATAAATDAPEVKSARYVATFLRQLGAVTRLPAEYDPAELGPLLSDDERDTLDRAAVTFARFAERVITAGKDPTR